MAPTRTITFVELAGREARARLGALQRAAADIGARGELLHGLDADDLWLLVLRDGEPPADALPEGARVWRFAAVEAP